MKLRTRYEEHKRIRTQHFAPPPVSASKIAKCPLCGRDLFGQIATRSHLRQKHDLTGAPAHDIERSLFPKVAARIDANIKANA